MIRWLAPLAGLAIAALIGFWLVLNAIPGFIMDRAMARIASDGARVNSVVHVAPTSEDSRRVVRPSPDILYSICLFDVSERPLRISIPAAEEGLIASISFFDANTNNFMTLRPINEARNVRLGDEIDAPTDEGVVLYRRILTGGVSMEDAETQRQAFACQPAG